MITSESESHTRTHTTKRLARRASSRPPVLSRVTLCAMHANLLQDTAPTSTCSIGFCVIWVCICPSSKRTATRLLRSRTRWRPWERPACFRAAEPRRGKGAPSAAALEPYGEWRAYRKSCFCAEQLLFRKDQVTRRNSVAMRATYENWRLAVEQGFTPIIARAEFQD